jgi:hypothetical protein
MPDPVATVPTLTPLAYRTLSLFAEGMNVAQIADATGQGWMAVRQVVNVHADGHRTNARRVVDAHPPMPPEDVDQAVADSLAKAGPPPPKVKAKPPAKPKKAAEPAAETFVADVGIPTAAAMALAADATGPTSSRDLPAEFAAAPAPSRERLTILADAIDVTPHGSGTFEPLAKATMHWALEATDTDPDLPEPDLPEPDAYDLATVDGLLANAAMHPDQAVRDAQAGVALRLDGLRRLILQHRRRELVAAEIAACEARLAKLRQWEAA